ncbi:MAG: BMP family ABC transporter substrate-binding protein [Candidatus Caldarchaeum sp.]
MNGSLTRRRFLGASTATLVGGVIGGAVLGGIGGYLLGQSSAPSAQPSTVTVTAARTTTVTQTVTATTDRGLGVKLRTAIVVPGRANDVGWNQQGVEGLRRAAEKFRADFSFSEGLGYGEGPIRAIQDYIRRDTDLVVAHAGGYRTVVKDIVSKRQAGNTKFLIVASEVGQATPEDLVSGVQATYSFEAAEAAYAAGYLAGLVTKTKVVGIVQSVESDTYWLRMSGGFAQGLKDANPESKLLFSVVGDYEEAVKSKEFTLAQIGQRADVIFGLGDGASFGMMEACSERGVWFIDVIGDKRLIDRAGILLTSVLWDFTPAYEQAIADIYNGTFGKSNYEISFFNRAIDLLQINPKVPADIRSAVAEMSEKVRARQKIVRTVYTPEQFYGLLRELGFG